MNYVQIGQVTDNTDTPLVTSFYDTWEEHKVGSTVHMYGKLSSMCGDDCILVDLNDWTQFSIALNQESPSVDPKIWKGNLAQFETIRNEDGFYLVGARKLS